MRSHVSDPLFFVHVRFLFLVSLFLEELSWWTWRSSNPVSDVLCWENNLQAAHMCAAEDLVDYTSFTLSKTMVLIYHAEQFKTAVINFHVVSASVRKSKNSSMWRNVGFSNTKTVASKPCAADSRSVYSPHFLKRSSQHTMLDVSKIQRRSLRPFWVGPETAVLSSMWKERALEFIRCSMAVHVQQHTSSAIHMRH